MCQHRAMDPGRTKPEQDVFLGTADIIHRVELAQANPVSRWVGSVRLYVVSTLSLLMGLGMVAMAWRTFRAPPHAHVHEAAAQSAGPAVAEQAGGPPPRGAEAPAVSSHVRPAGPKAAVAPERAGPQPLRVTVLHQSGALWLDGAKVAEKKHAWSGHVAPGRHQLAVRVGGHMMRHAFEVEGQPVSIVVDPLQQSFRVNVGHTGHHVGRSRAH